MLINEIVNNTQSLTEKLQYDSSKLSDVKMDNVTYKWDSNARVYREPDGSIIDKNGPLFYDLVRHKDNMNARVGGTPGDWQDRMARKGVVKGTRSAIAKKIGLSGMGKTKRLDPKAGLGAKVGATAGEYIGKGMDKIHNFVKGAIGNTFKKDPTNQKRYLNMQGSAKGIELLKQKVRTGEITMDEAGEVLQFVQGIHPSQKTKQPTNFQKAWRMWYAQSDRYKQALDQNKKERQKIQRQVDKVKQDNEKIRAANAQMPLNQRTPKKSFILGPDGNPASI